ncbi:MAG: dienelactone hydrolase family protein [Chloroflexi bacterium]|nr:dienelactone hydrolase family protein [Chloroflexota bacterium]
MNGATGGRGTQPFAFGREQALTVPAGKVTLEGNLYVPEDAEGIVVFVHGSGSSRLSPRNRFVATVLQEKGLATLLFDLLTAGEEAEDMLTASLRFDVSMLATRLLEVSRWLKGNKATGALNLGYFGASTGAGAALLAAAEQPELVKAVVSRGGRPDLAGPALSRVRAPTLLIVGGLDHPVIEINRDALARLTAEKEMAIVPRATHLFEEPGTLAEAARLAADWFSRYMTGPGN